MLGEPPHPRKTTATRLQTATTTKARASTAEARHWALLALFCTSLTVKLKINSSDKVVHKKIT